MSRVLQTEDVTPGMWVVPHSTFAQDRFINSGSGSIFDIGGTQTLVKGGWKEEDYPRPMLVLTVDLPFIVVLRAHDWQIREGKSARDTIDLRFKKLAEVTTEFAKASITQDGYDVLTEAFKSEVSNCQLREKTADRKGTANQPTPQTH